MAQEPRFRCSSCKKKKPQSQFHETKGVDRQRPVTSRCRECRSEARYRRLYPDTVCFQCLRHRALDRNCICQNCNAESGLRQCRTCEEILPMFLKFYGHRQACKDCLTSAETPEPELPQQGQPE